MSFLHGIFLYSALLLQWVCLRSLYLVSQQFPLSDTEVQVIAYHDGMYIPEGRSVAHKEEPLLLLLLWADMWTASVKEKQTIS